MSSVTRNNIAKAVRELGLQNRPVCLHSSLRSFGAVAGGAETVIQGFLGEGCTVMVPTFTHECGAARNGYDYTRTTTAHAQPGSYTVSSTDVSSAMARFLEQF